MKTYQHIFFDLDHTLWDYDSNARETLLELYDSYRLSELGINDFAALFSSFCTVNVGLWKLYDHGLINHETIRRDRFRNILAAFGRRDDALADRLSMDYLSICPQKCAVMPEAIETLEYLSGKYRMTVVTNGFEEIQHVKLASGRLRSFFDHIVTSQRAGSKKPHREIFEYALGLNGALPEDTLMVGDNPITDIGGAQNAGIDAVLFNPLNVEHGVPVEYEIRHLKELRAFL